MIKLNQLEAAASKSSIKMTMFIENESGLSGEQRVQFAGTADGFVEVKQMVDELNNLGFLSIGNPSDETGDEGGNLANWKRKRIRRILGVELMDVIHEKCDSEQGNGVDGWYYFNAEKEANEDKYLVLDLDSDDPGSFFSCPICDFDVELPVLCGHLREEHCFDLKNAVCPVCAANLGKDPVEHLTLQHPSLLKRRWKFDKPSIWYGNSAMLGKKRATDSRGNKHEPASDPLLSPFLCEVSVPNPDSIHRDELSINNVPVTSDANSTGTNTVNLGEQDHQERREKAMFVQEVVASTIF